MLRVTVNRLKVLLQCVCQDEAATGYVLHYITIVLLQDISCYNDCVERFTVHACL